jgi:hypothetical protein
VRKASQTSGALSCPRMRLASGYFLLRSNYGGVGWIVAPDDVTLVSGLSRGHRRSSPRCSAHALVLTASLPARMPEWS